MDQDAHRTRGKVERALERLRRVGVKMIDSTPDGKGRAPQKELDNLRSFLAGVAQVYGSLEVSIPSSLDYTELKAFPQRKRLRT